MSSLKLAIERQTPLRRAPRTEPVGACPLCGDRRTRVYFRTHDHLHNVPGEFTYRRCEACRTVFQDPCVIPADLAQCYPDDYYTHFGPDAPPAASDAVRPRRWGRVRDELRHLVIAGVQRRPAAEVGRALAISRRLREQAFFGLMDELIPRRAEAGRALEVGCGAGRLLMEMRRVGWRIEGVEWDARAAIVARQVSGCHVYNGDFRAITLPLGSYNLVVLHHVFEHLADPIGALRRCAALLAPGGQIMLCYPNPESLGARFFRAAYMHWDAPRHLVLPPYQALDSLARQAGLRLLAARTLSRRAEYDFLQSRAYRKGQRIVNENPGAQERLLALAERVLTLLGARVGKEIVCVMAK